MKKIFTLVLLAAGTISIATAQSKNQKNNPIAYKQHDTKSMGNDYNQPQGFDKNKTVAYSKSYFSLKEKEAQIQKINREFDQKIAAVKMNRHLRNQEKTKQIKMLEHQRKTEIAQIQSRYEKSNQHNIGFQKNDEHKW